MPGVLIRTFTADDLTLLDKRALYANDQGDHLQMGRQIMEPVVALITG